MKKFKKIIACVMAVATLGALTVVPMSINAIAKIIINPNTGEEFGIGAYDELIGWSSDGTPIVKVYSGGGSVPEDAPAIDNTSLGDSVETVGGSDTGIRGDINYDGKVNVSDLIYLRRYLLHLIKW